MKRHLKILIYGVCTLFLVAGCVAQKQDTQAEFQEVETPDTDAVLEAITRAWAEHVAAHKRADPDGAAAIYTEDVMIFADGGYEACGRPAQRAYYAELHRTKTIKDATYTTEELEVCGDTAYELSSCSVTIESEGLTTTERARYISIWKRQANGSWKIHRLIGHSVPSSEQ